MSAIPKSRKIIKSHRSRTDHYHPYVRNREEGTQQKITAALPLQNANKILRELVIETKNKNKNLYLVPINFKFENLSTTELFNMGNDSPNSPSIGREPEYRNDSSDDEPSQHLAQSERTQTLASQITEIVNKRMISIILFSLINHHQNLYIMAKKGNDYIIYDKTEIKFVHINGIMTAETINPIQMKNIYDTQGINGIINILNDFKIIQFGGIDYDIRTFYDFISNFYKITNKKYKHKNNSYIIMLDTNQLKFRGIYVEDEIHKLAEKLGIDNIFFADTDKAIPYKVLTNYISDIYKDNEWITYENHLIPTSMSGGKIKDKYKINIDKKTNFIYIKYNNNKVFLYKNLKDKIFITLDNKVIYITKKNFNHDKKTNKIYIKLT